MSTAAALDAARAFFADEGIPFPPVPDGFRVEAIRPREWGCGGPDARLIERDAFLAALEREDFVRFGVDGYSTPAVCFYAARGPAAVLVQVRWGGFEFDLAAEAERLRETWGRVRAFLQAPGGDRRIVVWTYAEPGARWGRVHDGGVDWEGARPDGVFEAAVDLR
jgi:hypothetical protein